MNIELELGLENTARKLVKELEFILNKSGIMYRIFYRVKSRDSIERKIKVKNYEIYKKKITDLIGIRITLYFPDDVELIQDILQLQKSYDHISKNEFSIEEFKPVRCNLTFRIPEEYNNDLRYVNESYPELIENTYEIQLRTVLSEGWHEVEHDLRYKCQEDWAPHNDLNRNLNGIYATLETSEFSMLQLFSELTYRHYKSNNIESMIRNHLRIKFSNGNLSAELNSFLIDNKKTLKEIYKTPRNKILKFLLGTNLSIPLTIDNVIYIINYLYIKNEMLNNFAGTYILGELENVTENLLDD